MDLRDVWGGALAEEREIDERSKHQGYRDQNRRHKGRAELFLHTVPLASRPTTYPNRLSYQV